MPYVTSVERLATKRGMEQGMQQGEIAVMKRLLHKRFGELPEEVELRLHKATPEQLEVWTDRVLDVQTLAEVFGSHWRGTACSMLESSPGCVRRSRRRGWERSARTALARAQLSDSCVVGQVSAFSLDLPGLHRKRLARPNRPKAPKPTDVLPEPSLNPRGDHLQALLACGPGITLFTSNDWTKTKSSDGNGRPFRVLWR